VIDAVEDGVREQVEVDDRRVMGPVPVPIQVRSVRSKVGTRAILYDRQTGRTVRETEDVFRNVGELKIIRDSLHEGLG
jgi:hypothetical protein